MMVKLYFGIIVSFVGFSLYKFFTKTVKSTFLIVNADWSFHLAFLNSTFCLKSFDTHKRMCLALTQTMHKC